MTSTLGTPLGIGDARGVFDTSVERERLLALASDILQGQSAVFLLIQASRAPDLGRLECAIDRVRDWIDEFGSLSADLGGSDRCSENASTALLARMTRAQAILERFAPFRGRALSGVAARQVTEAIAESQLQLVRARQNSETFETIIGSCCAADVSDIAKRRIQ